MGIFDKTSFFKAGNPLKHTGRSNSNGNKHPVPRFWPNSLEPEAGLPPGPCKALE